MTVAPPLFCDQCGSALVSVAYGYPSPGMLAAEERGELVLGGCMPGDATVACPRCPDGGGRPPWPDDLPEAEAVVVAPEQPQPQLEPQPSYEWPCAVCGESVTTMPDEQPANEEVFHPSCLQQQERQERAYQAEQRKLQRSEAINEALGHALVVGMLVTFVVMVALSFVLYSKVLLGVSAGVAFATSFAVAFAYKISEAPHGS